MKKRYKKKQFSTTQKLQQQLIEIEKLRTKYKYTFNSLRSLKNDYNDLVKNASIAILTDDRNGRFIYFNKKFVTLFGYSNKEMTKQSIQKLVHPEDIKWVMKYHRARIRGRKAPSRYEFRGIKKNGTIINIAVDVERLKRENKVIGTRSYLWDITDRKTIEEKLHYQADLLANVTNAIISTDLKFKIRTWNKAAENMYGWKAHEVIDKCYFRVTKLRCPHHRLKYLQTHVLEKGLWQGEIIQKHKKGAIINVLTSMSLIKNKNSSPINIVLLNHNITEKKHFEEKLQRANIALRQNTGQLSAILESIGDCLTMLDRNLNIIWANETAKKIFGKDIIGKKCYQVYHRRKKPCKPIACPVQQSLKDGKVHEYDTHVFDKNGAVVYFHCTGNVTLRDENGNPTAVLEISRDITKQKLIEQELLKSHKELGQKVQKRTIELKKANDILIAEIVKRKSIENALKQSEQDFRGLFESANDAIIIFEPVSRNILDANKKACKIYGFAYDDFVGMPLDKITENIARMKKHIEFVLNKGFDYHLDTIHYDKDGLTIHFEVSASLVTYKGQQAILSINRDITEHKRMEDAIKAAYAELNQIFDTVGDGMCVVDKNSNILRINQQFSNLLKVSSDQAVGRKCYDVFPGSMCDTSQCPLKRVLNGEKHFEHEAEKQLPDGSTTLFLVTTSAFQGPKGELIGIVQIYRDISIIKHTEYALKNAAQQWRTTFDAISDAVSLLDHKNRIQRCNAAMSKLLGKPIKDIIGHHCCKLIHGVLKPIKKCPIVNMQKKKTRETQLFYLNNQWLNVSVDPLMDESNNIIGIVHIMRNVTEQKQVEEQIIRQNVFMNNILDSLTHPFYVINVNNYIIEMANTAAYKGNLPRNATCYKYIHKTDYPCSGAEHQCPIEKVKITKNPVTLEHIHYDEGGQQRHYEVHGYPIFDRKGNVVQMIEYGLDITQRKTMEKELLNVQKLESVSLLAGGIAHDFNNILTSILGNIDIAKILTDPDNRVFERLIKAEKATLQAKNLTHQLLTFSRGGVPVKKTISIADLVRESVSFTLRGSNVRCEFHIANNLWTVEVDEGQMSQVINNLIINAEQAMPEGGLVEVTIENFVLESADDPTLEKGSYVKISIEDHGIGIPEEHMPKIFDPYYTTKKRGSGLGLTISYSIIKKHNGYINVASEINTGTAVDIYLPASQKEITSGKKKIQQPITGKGRILIMDDEKGVRDTVGEMLKYLGYSTRFAGNGNDAIELYKQAKRSMSPYDIVIIDLTIPGSMGGKETIKKLIELDPGVKAIVSSGYSNDPIMANYKEYGFCGVIAKPFRIKELSELIHNIITQI